MGRGESISHAGGGGWCGLFLGGPSWQVLFGHLQSELGWKDVRAAPGPCSLDRAEMATVLQSLHVMKKQIHPCGGFQKDWGTADGQGEPETQA